MQRVMPIYAGTTNMQLLVSVVTQRCSDLNQPAHGKVPEPTWLAAYTGWLGLCGVMQHDTGRAQPAHRKAPGPTWLAAYTGWLGAQPVTLSMASAKLLMRPST